MDKTNPLSFERSLQTKQKQIKALKGLIKKQHTLSSLI